MDHPAVSFGFPDEDCLLAECLLKKNQCSDPNIFALLCYMSLCLKAGHLCVSLDAPSIDQVWDKDEPLSEEVKKALKEAIQQGIRALPEDFYGIVRKGPLIYFQKYFDLEEAVKRHLKDLIDQPPFPLISDEVVEEGLFEEQKQAIYSCFSKRLTLLCGGPGTGKTYTARKLLKLLPKGLSIAIAAPTGKAAAHLVRSLDIPLAASGTLHSLLKPKNVLPFDVILVDESSMIDVKIMKALLSSLKAGSRLILLGDPHQLPPVEAGHLFSDLAKQLIDHKVTLQTCVRTDLKEIIAFSHAVKQGDVNEVLHLLEGGHPGLTWMPLEKLPLDKDQVLLTPFRKGRFGVEALNQRLLETLPLGALCSLPILLTKNAPHLNLFNGELGTMVGKKSGGGFYPEQAHFQERSFSPHLLPGYDFAFCLSVHKSQGSEFDHVHLLLPPGSQDFGREVLYTGATRAKKHLTIYCDLKTLEETIASPTIRLSGFN